jgi:hypothetical protein
MPLMFASRRCDVRLRVCVRVISSSLIGPAGSELTNSVRRRAGTVIAPSSCTSAPTQQWMPISRSVAESFSRDASVASRMFDRTGSVLRLATARLTMASPRARFSWRQDSFIAASSCGAVSASIMAGDGTVNG